MAEIDERYKRGMIYTIRNIKDDTMVYVGSTINSLSKRFNSHKDDCKYTKSCIKLHSLIENNDWTDWYIELYELYPCNSKKELERREGQVIREIGTINKNIAGRTKKEYREVNVEKVKKWYKKYNDNNVEKIKEKVCCNICGDFIGKHYLKHHQKSKSCMSKIPDNTDIPSDIHI